MRYIGENSQAKVNEVILCYDDLGKESIPVIFIHGFPFDKSMWQPQMDFLKTTHRVISYDIRGFGKSTAGNEKISITLLADDLVQLIDVLMIPKAVVCGLSMGGYILLNALNRYPERFEAIILADTQCIDDTPEGKEKRHTTIEQIQTLGLKEFAEVYVKNIFCEQTLQTNYEPVMEIKSTILSTSPETITNTLLALAERYEMCSSLPEISVPALVLYGMEDKLIPLAQYEYLFNTIKGATSYCIADAGHLSNLEQPKEFNHQVLNFLNGLHLTGKNKSKSILQE